MKASVIRSRISLTRACAASAVRLASRSRSDRIARSFSASRNSVTSRQTPTRRRCPGMSWPHDPLLHLERIARFHGPSNRVFHRFPVLRMDSLEKRGIGRFELARLEAVDAEQLVRPAHDVRLDFPFETSNVCDLLRVGELPLTLQEQLFGELPVRDIDGHHQPGRPTAVIGFLNVYFDVKRTAV